MKKEPHWASRLGCQCCCHGEVCASEFQMTFPFCLCYQPFKKKRRPRPPKDLGSTLVLEFDHYSLHPWNQKKKMCLLFSSSHLRYILGIWKHGKEDWFSLCMWPWFVGILTFSLGWIYASFQGLFFFFFCLLNGNIIFFFLISRKGGKKGIWSTFPLPSYLPISTPHPHPPPHTHTWAQLPVATHSCNAFLLLGFSLNRSEIAAPVVFSKLILSRFKKRNQNALLH